MIDHPKIMEYANKAFGRFGKTLPKTMAAFGQLQKATFQDGALDIKTKELIALGISVAEGCDGCMAYHNAALLELGASRDEVAEAVGVAVEMGGGVALYSAVKALDGFDQLAAA
ncbi:MAG: carboxymuconolactone decarboxylase family protein [Rhodospirillales bacterium]|nr:carboxymuconolactone decarboxylase family protein [Rhodospirillales bacterium]